MRTAADDLAQRVSDTSLEAQSECWSAGLAYYAVLAKMAEHDAMLQAALAPVVDFFALGKRIKKAPPAP